MKTGIIYEWRNKLDGKFYVGQTINPESRYKDHLKAKGDSLFHRAIRLHGIENFEYTVVATYEHETEQGLYDLLNEAEIERIKFRNSLAPNGYNVTHGGEGGNVLAGYTQEQYEEFCKKISERMKGKNAGEKNPMKNPETVKKMADAKRGKPSHMKGKHHSDDVRKKCGAKNKGKHWYNNGIDEHPYFKGEQPDGWVRGRIIGKYNLSDKQRAKISKSLSKSMKGKNKGKHPYNNGEIEIRRRDDEVIPDGFVRGPLKKSA